MILLEYTPNILNCICRHYSDQIESIGKTPTPILDAQ